MTGKVTVMDHPLIAHKISYIRREDVGTKEFREMIGEIAQLMCYEATRDLKLKDVKIKTPIAEMTGKELAGKKLAIVPILRAGVGMVDGMLSLIPAAKVGHIGLYRDPETLEPVEYYCKLPADCSEREVFVVDPMLATGGSSVAAIRMLKEKGVKNIRFLCIIAAPEGLKRMQEEHPDVDVYIGALDERLNDHGYPTLFPYTTLFRSISYPGSAMPGTVSLERNKQRRWGQWRKRRRKEQIIYRGTSILWGWQCFRGCVQRIRIHRSDAVLSARIIKSCQWATMVSRSDARMTNSRGRETGRTRWRQNMSTPPTVS